MKILVIVITLFAAFSASATKKPPRNDLDNPSSSEHYLSLLRMYEKSTPVSYSEAYGVYKGWCFNWYRSYPAAVAVTQINDEDTAGPLFKTSKAVLFSAFRDEKNLHNASAGAIYSMIRHPALDYSPLKIELQPLVVHQKKEGLELQFARNQKYLLMRQYCTGNPYIDDEDELDFQHGDLHTG